VIDECHHVPAVSFESVLKRIQARHFLGLTATPYRKDGLEKIITMQCGPALHTMEETKAQALLSRQVFVRETGFRMGPEASAQPARLVQYAGRLHRESAGKQDVRIYDYIDANLGLCITMFRKRMTTYRKMGYTVEIPPDSHLSEVVGRKPGRKTGTADAASMLQGPAETT
jgi:superfamily II DNA or RNA helicase